MQSVNDSQALHAGAVEILAEIDSFITGKKVSVPGPSTPQLITVPAFKGRTLKSRVANLATRIPLRLIRKSTKDYHLYQKNLNHELQREIQSLKYQIQILRREMDGRK